ncbi:uncharacterized protein LOC113398106 isoform X2 [Vanessa tameamea]|uniref:Uncharacterized protein LOC113398106 isoform X2 n=1 Tax=Vanessa tameamea TaxID=334116 RepID=A0A8B8I801_VANTA|nr:uncharacterized protein LOC113398106 isoform X2 [Vanessa tameamea]
MTSLIYVIAFALLGQARSGLVELNCSDNATCIDHMAKEFVRSLRQQKTIKVFDLLTIEPIGNRQARSNQDPVTRLITTHAISFDWNDFTFRFSNPEDRSDALDLEVFESRSVKDVSDEVPKKTKGKDEEEVIEDKRVHIRPIKRRRHRRKVMQAVIPLLFGMKSAGVVIFALFMVSVITIKAFLASKMALMVTVGMAMKKLYESYGGGVPATSNVLWNLARYFRILFGLPDTPLSSPSMTMPMYALPQMQNDMQSQMFSPTMAMPTAQ